MIASFKMDESYYKEDLSEWISSVSKGRKYEPYLCELFLLFGITLLVFFPNYKITGIAAIVIGIYESIKFLKFKKQWMKDRISSDAFGKAIVVEFNNGEIKLLKSDTDQIKLLISKIRIIVSKKGYFIYPKEYLHIYVPFASFSPPISRDEALKFMQANHGMQTGAAEPRR